MPTLFNEILKFIYENPLGNRQVGFVTGCLLLLTGLINLIFNGLTVNIASFAIDVAVLVIGLLAVLVEYKVTLLPLRLSRYLKEDWLIISSSFFS